MGVDGGVLLHSTWWCFGIASYEAASKQKEAYAGQTLQAARKGCNKARMDVNQT
jgi:hypothetical protein